MWLRQDSVISDSIKFSTKRQEEPCGGWMETLLHQEREGGQTDASGVSSILKENETRTFKSDVQSQSW